MFGPSNPEPLLLKLRGYLALFVLCVGLLVADLVQRLVVTPWLWLRPSRRTRILGRWIHLMAWYVTTVASRVAGADIPAPDRVVPAEPGHLILMNHQSLWDIPTVVQAVNAGYPRIVTRQRYSRFVPLISHMVRLYQYPVVDPTASKSELKEALNKLEVDARASDVPIALFPEGTRTKNGEVGPFKMGGLARILGSRAWTVHLLVTDGYWKAAKFKGIAGRLGTIRGQVRYLGTMEWSDPGADPGPFVAEARERIVDGLVELRQQVPAA